MVFSSETRFFSEEIQVFETPEKSSQKTDEKTSLKKTDEKSAQKKLLEEKIALKKISDFFEITEKLLKEKNRNSSEFC